MAFSQFYAVHVVAEGLQVTRDRNQEGVMALRSVDLQVADVFFGGHQGIHKLARAGGRETPVGGERHHAEARLGPGNYAHNDDDGDIVGLGLGLNVPLGPLMATVGGRGVYLNPQYSKEGYALAVGGGLKWPIGESFAVFGDYYYSPQVKT